MLLVLDIGNSDITIGLWDSNTWRNIWRLPSKPDQPEVFYKIRIRDHFFEANVSLTSVKLIVVSSVVPELTENLEKVVEGLFEKKAITLGPKVYKQLPIEVLNPYEIGSDLVANAFSAYHLLKKTCIVVDFGTALTFTSIDGMGKMLGVSITPGLKTAMKSLTQNTAKLFDVSLQMPKSALGTNTVTAIQSGILFGYDGLVRSLVHNIRKELNDDCPAIATGGLLSVITPLKDFFHAVEPNLTLNGLRLVGELYKK